MKILQSKPIFTVDELGNVYLTKSGRKLKPWVDKDGYLRCNTSFNGKNCHITPHRAVAESYGLKLPPKKEKVGIKYLIEEKKSLGITYEEMVADYLGDKKV